MKRLFLVVVGVAAALVLSSCGGGGGGGTPPNPYAGSDWKWLDDSHNKPVVDRDGNITGEKDTSGWGHVHITGKIDQDGNWRFLVNEAGVNFWGHCETRSYSKDYDLVYRGKTYWLMDGAGSPAPDSSLDDLLGRFKQR